LYGLSKFGVKPEKLAQNFRSGPEILHLKTSFSKLTKFYALFFYLTKKLVSNFTNKSCMGSGSLVAKIPEFFIASYILIEEERMKRKKKD
jgi:hypothetical protein